MIRNFYQKTCSQYLQHICQQRFAKLGGLGCCPPACLRQSRWRSGRRGITVIELLVVLAVLGIIFSIVLPQFSKIKENQVLKAGIQDVLSSIDKARSQTLSSLNSSSYGVHFESDKVIIFKSIVFSASDLNNETINITSPATISAIALTGGGEDVYFNRLNGAPNKTGTITVSTPSASKIITISATGAVSVN